VVSEETRHLILVIAGFVVPIAASPFVVAGLRPLFAIFLREGLELFTDISIARPLSEGIGRAMANANVVMLLLAWLGAFGARVLEWSISAAAAVAVLGVLLALATTIRMMKTRVSIMGHRAVLVGLLTFAGGNLPIFLLVPIVLLLR
jgi:hypothetical protein